VSYEPCPSLSRVSHKAPESAPQVSFWGLSHAKMVSENGVHEVPPRGCPDDRLMSQGVSTSLTSENKPTQPSRKAKKPSKTPLLSERAGFRGGLIAGRMELHRERIALHPGQGVSASGQWRPPSGCPVSDSQIGGREMLFSLITGRHAPTLLPCAEGLLSRPQRSSSSGSDSARTDR
jgi:hypothetical protein